MLIKRYYTVLSDIFANFYQLQIKHVMLERQLLDRHLRLYPHLNSDAIIGTLLSIISGGDVKTQSTTRGSELLLLYCLKPMTEKNGGP